MPEGIVLQPWPGIIDITAIDETLPTFPTKMLPPPFSTFVEDIADRMQVPPDFAGIPLLIEAATMLGTEFRLQPKRHDDWSERPCLWGMIVALSGDRKSPPAEETLRPITKMQGGAWESHKHKLDAWKAEPKATRGPPPRSAKILVNESTVEALMSTMADSPRGMMLYRDELAGWLKSMDKYRAGGDDRQFFLQCWSGGAYGSDRKTEESSYVADLYLNIYGTIQPGVAQQVFRNGDADGMNARFQLAVCPNVPRSVSFVDKRPDFDTRKKVEDRLREMRAATAEDEDRDGWPASKALRFDGEAYAIFNEWMLRNDNRSERKDDTAFGTHISKYPGTFARLALVLHFMKHGKDAPKSEVDKETANTVRVFIDDYLEPHAKHLYGILGAHPARPGAVRIAHWLRDKKIKVFTVRDVRRNQWNEFTKIEDDTKSIAAALNLLEAFGWVREEAKPSGPGGGRPTVRWLVNPAVSAVSA